MTDLLRCLLCQWVTWGGPAIGAGAEPDEFGFKMISVLKLRLNRNQFPLQLQPPTAGWRQDEGVWDDWIVCTFIRLSFLQGVFENGLRLRVWPASLQPSWVGSQVNPNYLTELKSSANILCLWNRFMFSSVIQAFYRRADRSQFIPKLWTMRICAWCAIFLSTFETSISEINW